MSEQEQEFYSKSEDSKYGKKINKFTRTKESLIKLFFHDKRFSGADFYHSYFYIFI